MDRARWTRPSCLVMLALLAIVIATFLWLVSGEALRTPNPATVTKATTTYDTDIPPSQPPVQR
jgi:hypothetical protein